MPPSNSPGARRRRRVALPIVAIAAILVPALAYGVYWFILAGRLEAATIAWIEQRRTQGYAIAHRGLERRGFPGAIEVSLRMPSIRAPAAEAIPWMWSAEETVVAVQPWAPNRVTIAPGSPFELAVGAGATPQRYQGQAERLEFVGAMGWERRAGTVHVDELNLMSASGAVLAVAGLGIDVRVVAGNGSGGSTENSRDPTLDVSLAATGVRLPGSEDLPLGDALESLGLSATVHGPLPESFSEAALSRWRDAGGVIDVAALEVAHGPLRLRGTGTIALDADGQPIAAFATTIRGLFDTVDTLQARGHLEDGAAMAITLALAVVAGTTDRSAAVEAPVTLQERTFSIGPVDLLKVPPVRWPQGK